MPETRVQVVLLNVPVLFVVKVTVPVGVPVDEVTVAEQLVGVLSRTLAGEQVTLVVLPPDVAVTVNAALVLPLWTLFPPYTPVMPW